MLKKDRKKQILGIVDDYCIYNYYIDGLKIGSAIRSPLRDERRPSFVVKYGTNGNLYHIDYGNSDYYGNCFSFVMQKFGISFEEALEKIYNEVCLGFSDNTQTHIPPKERKETKPRKIEVITKSFDKRDLKWWLQYGITEEDLIREHIFAVDHFFMDDKKGNPKRMYQSQRELCYAYKFFDLDDNFLGWKVYFPLREDFKWFSSIPNSTMEGFNNVKNLSRLIITKSRKDRVVLSKLLDNVVNSQNESRSFLTESNLEIISQFKEVWLWYDNDKPGIKASKTICSEYGWKRIITPNPIIKDPAEWVKLAGDYTELKEFLKLNLANNR